jgi:hypothetical protein
LTAWARIQLRWNATSDQRDFRLINIIEEQYDPQIKVWAGNAKL